MAEGRSPVTAGGKSAAAFRTISEVSEEIDVPQHVLRFWETKFSQIRPLKRGGGRRYYRPEDIELLRQIRDWLYTEGYTIRGVQKLLRGVGAAASEPALRAESAGGITEKQRAALTGLLDELTTLRDRIRRGPQ